MARDSLGARFGKDFEQAFGKKTGKALLHSTAGRYGRGMQTFPVPGT